MDPRSEYHQLREDSVPTHQTQVLIKTHQNCTGTKDYDLGNNPVPLVPDLIQTAIAQKTTKISKPICRICFGSSKGSEALIAPCSCKGSIGYVHKSCLERWLETRCIDACELCNFRYSTIKTRKSLLSWFIDPSTRGDRRNLFADLVCCLFLTPLGLVSFWLCAQGAFYFFQMKSALLEASSLMALAFFLAFAYFTWIVMSTKYHYAMWTLWHNRNLRIRLVWPPAATSDECCSAMERGVLLKTLGAVCASRIWNVGDRSRNVFHSVCSGTNKSYEDGPKSPLDNAERY